MLSERHVAGAWRPNSLPLEDLGVIDWRMSQWFASQVAYASDSPAVRCLPHRHLLGLVGGAGRGPDAGRRALVRDAAGIAGLDPHGLGLDQCGRGPAAEAARRA